MSMLAQIANGEAGSSVRAKLNALIDRAPASLLDYGGVSDGPTGADNGIALNTAIGETATYGKTLWVPAGSYRLATRPQIVAGMRVVCHPQAKFYPDFTGANFFMNPQFYTPVSGWSWSGGQFLLDPGNQWAGDVLSPHGDDWIIEDLVIKGFGANGSGRLFTGGGTYKKDISDFQTVNGSDIVNSAQANWSNTDIGALFFITYGGVYTVDSPWVARIKRVISPTQVQLDRAANDTFNSGSRSASFWRFGSGGRLSRVNFQAAENAGWHNGGVRVYCGSVTVTDCWGVSGDDVWQALPTEASHGNTMACRNVLFDNCRGGSTAAKLCIAGAMIGWAETTGVRFSNVAGFASSNALVTISYGANSFVGDIVFENVSVRMRSGQGPYLVTNNGGTIDGVTLDDCSISGQQIEALVTEDRFSPTDTRIKNVVIRGGEYRAPKLPGYKTFDIRNVENLELGGGLAVYGQPDPNFWMSSYPVSMTAGSNALTSQADSAWGATVSTHILGMAITVRGAGSGGADLVTTVSAVNSNTSLTLADAAATTITDTSSIITGTVSTLENVISMGQKGGVGKVHGAFFDGLRIRDIPDGGYGIYLHNVSSIGIENVAFAEGAGATTAGAIQIKDDPTFISGVCISDVVDVTGLSNLYPFDFGSYWDGKDIVGETAAIPLPTATSGTNLRIPYWHRSGMVQVAGASQIGRIGKPVFLSKTQRIELLISSTITISHNMASSGDYVGINLKAGANTNYTARSRVVLVYNPTTSQWDEW